MIVVTLDTNEPGRDAALKNTKISTADREPVLYLLLFARMGLAHPWHTV